MKVRVEFSGRETVELDLQLDGGLIRAARLTGVGDLKFLRFLASWRSHLQGELLKLTLPKGNSSVEIMIREAILKAQGRWQSPYADEELCHCRAVPTRVVEAAIVGGAHSCERVSRETSASTSCGTCRSDVQSLLDYRLLKVSKQSA